jgi:hypothetical protein
MKMFFDVSSLDQTDITGIGVYTKNLLKYLRPLSETSLYPICSASRWMKRQPRVMVIQRGLLQKR